MLGGEIHVASQKGEGSCFTLVLPVKLARIEMEEMPSASGYAALESPRIELKTMPRTAMTEFIADDRHNIGNRDKVLLIIEDDPTFAATLMMVARRRSYKCLAAGDGKTGLVLATEEPVTAILLDLKLPDIDGNTCA
jgi:PleD family two-component response regulator